MGQIWDMQRFFGCREESFACAIFVPSLKIIIQQLSSCAINYAT